MFCFACLFVLKSMFISGVLILMSSVRPTDVQFQTTSSADLSFFFPRVCCCLVFEFVVALLVLYSLFTPCPSLSQVTARISLIHESTIKPLNNPCGSHPQVSNSTADRMSAIIKTFRHTSSACHYGQTGRGGLLSQILKIFFFLKHWQ